jgi:hypothetical protein
LVGKDEHGRYSTKAWFLGPDAFGSLAIDDALGTIFESQDGVRAVIHVAIVIAIGESGPDFSQIALSDWLTAQHTKRLWAGCPAIH